VSLTSDGAVSLQIHREQNVDAAALVGVLNGPPAETWTGVLFCSAESFEWLDLWLACTMRGGLSRMPAQASASEGGLVRPQFGWGAMAVAEGSTVAYLTLRPAHRGAAEGRRYEVGVIGHGPACDSLADRVADEIRIWDAGYRSRAVQMEIQPAHAPAPIGGQFVFDRPWSRLAISWE
jgi:protein-L-isoaspartate(D-aspartate) O-methyltransferase